MEGHCMVGIFANKINVTPEGVWVIIQRNAQYESGKDIYLSL